MFVGAVPTLAVEQITRIVPFDQWGKVFIGCSGSFRFDRAVKLKHPLVEVHSNDVSLLSCALGTLALGDEFSVTFHGKLAFIEQHVAGGPFSDRVAAILVALEIAPHDLLVGANSAGRNFHRSAHLQHYEDNFLRFLESARDRVRLWLDNIAINSFTPGDFHLQIDRAIAEGGGVAAFPPTYKGGYEKLYDFVHQNISWPAPTYDLWEPKDLPGLILRLREKAVPHCFVTDHSLDGIEASAAYYGKTNKPVYTYASTIESSIRRRRFVQQTFGYEPVCVDDLTRATEVTLVTANNQQMNFVRWKYLSSGIDISPGQFNYLVFLDGKMAGAFMHGRYNKKWLSFVKRGEGEGEDKKVLGQHVISLLSDFAVTRKRKVSKLIAMLATGGDPVRIYERRFMQRIKWLSTWVFTPKPMSMKYRGVFRLIDRFQSGDGKGCLWYASKVRRATSQKIYEEWFDRYA